MLRDINHLNPIVGGGEGDGNHFTFNFLSSFGMSQIMGEIGQIIMDVQAGIP